MMKKNFGRFILLLILLLNSCNFPGPRPSTSTETSIAVTDIPSAEATIPIPGDLGFGKIVGRVTDAVTGTPISGATVTCKHFSYTSKEADRCHRSTMTDQDGSFLFEDVFFHDTDTITLIVESTGYKPASLKYASFTQPLLEVDIQLSK